MAAKKRQTKAANKTTAKRKKSSSSSAQRKTSTKKKMSSKATQKKVAAKPKKTVSKKTPSTKKSSSAKVVSSAPAKPAKVGVKPFTKSQLFSVIAEANSLPKKQVGEIFDTLGIIIKDHLNGPGQFTLPGLVKLVKKRKPAKKARKGINPFTGEETIFKAKPAQNVVKPRVLTQIKDMV